MYDVLPSLVLGFHGCDHEVAEAVLAGDTHLRPSANSYDWLGHGVYLWESSPLRAMDHAHMLRRDPRRGRGKVKEPAVVGAVLSQGRCLNLLDADHLSLVRSAHQRLSRLYDSSSLPMPLNKSVDGNLLLRYLDCAVIESVHSMMMEKGDRPYDTVRGVFWEGKPLYEGSGIHDGDHVQICVRNARSIKGYFRVLESPRDTSG